MLPSPAVARWWPMASSQLACVPVCDKMVLPDCPCASLTCVGLVVGDFEGPWVGDVVGA
jgi:hypothetical protein